MKFGRVITAAFLTAASSPAIAHTNSVGFLLSGTQASGSCVAGLTTAVNCVNVEVFYGTWHSNTLVAEGDLAIWILNADGSKTQVIGQSATGGTQTPFSMSDSLDSTIPDNPSSSYSDTTGTPYSNLSGAFSIGSNYFFHDDSNDVLVGDPTSAYASGDVDDVWAHQSAVAVGLGAGTYLIAYDGATVAGLSATWSPQAAVEQATFTITLGGSIIVNTGGDAAPLIQGPDGFAGDAVSSAILSSGATSVHTFSANETVTWSVSGTDASLFNMNPTTGELQFASGGACVSPNDPGLDNLYSVRVTATDTGGNTPAQDVTLTCPSTSPADSPTALVATPGDGQVSIAFTAPASNGGAAITDYEYQLDGGSWTSASTTSSPVVITGLTNGTSYSIKLRAVNSAGNGAASAAVSFDTPSPASAFAQDEGEIRAVIVNDVTRSLQSTMSANDRMIRDARSRFIDSQRQSSFEEVTVSSCRNVALDVDGTAQVSGTTLSTRGTFFGQTGNFECTQRRLVFGDFDLQHDGDTGSSTATLTGRIAWEQMTSEQTMLGYFIGGELAQSNIAGSFEGDQNRLGVTAGGYVVHQLKEQVFLDGFITLGAGRNNLKMTKDVLALESDYTTQTATVGAALSGIYSYGQYDLRPELAFSYGQTWIGDVGFTGRAYGLVDDTLSLDAGNVSLANLTLRPEMIWALDAETVADSNSQLSFAPRLICERTTAATTTQDCGAGAEIGLMSQSEDGLSSANIRFVMDRVGNSNRSNVVFNLEQRF